MSRKSQSWAKAVGSQFQQGHFLYVTFSYHIQSSTKSDPQIDAPQGEAVHSGASSPITGELAVVTSAANIASATEASTSTTSNLGESACDLQNPGIDQESTEEPKCKPSESTTKDTNDEETSSAAEEDEKPTPELEYKYECKFLEEHYIKDSHGYYRWQIIDAGMAPPKRRTLANKRLQAKSKALKRVICRCLGDRDPTWKLNEDDTMEYSWPWESWFRGLGCFKAEKARLEGLIEKNGGARDKSNKDWEEMTTCGVLIDTLETYHESALKAMKELILRGCVNYEMVKGKYRYYEFRSSEYCKPSDRATAGHLEIDLGMLVRILSLSITHPP
ncbi:hypothetical protein EV426DRAFT_640036 [Tirmania nivea]|nr:hypothetical protein EV426DRAFT_640036 [Tirmania nivea]